MTENRKIRKVFKSKPTLEGAGVHLRRVFGNSEVSAQGEPVRFLLISGRPIKEPVAWYGPIVMNTEEELEVAFEEYRNGTFIK